VSRRTLLKGLLGASAVGALGACGSDDSETGDTPGADGLGSVTFGSNYSDELPREALAATIENYTETTGNEVAINTIDHNTYQENITNYLQGGPDDVWCWFAGYRMQFFADQGLAGVVDDVWDEIGGGYTDAMRQMSTGLDGQLYFVPQYYYPWAVFYRRSLWEENGYEEPATMDEYVSLCDQMQADGLVPLAFADQGGWEAMGTFDYLNMRTNGFDFHISLMAGHEAWNSTEVRNVFGHWRDLMPYHQPNALGRDWQQAAQSLLDKECGMYLLGLFVGNQFPDDERADLDFFAFPEIDPAIGADAVEAPIDGFMMAPNPRNEDGAKALLAYLGSAEGQEIYLDVDPNNIAAHEEADRSGYTDIQVKSAELVSAAGSISQFLDRDTRPDFASTVMIPSLQQFIRDPDDIDSLTDSIEDQKQAIFDA
jgi:multiple sugar transport system substrate-binding protein